jgi:DNA-binding transcriptional LysR family regulator
MDSKKLSYLATVIEYGSFRNAARHLDVSQPALSKSIDRLERELGVKLLERSAGGVLATPMGEILYSHAKSIREELDLATERMQASGATSSDIITFGTLPSLASSVIPLALARWVTAGRPSDVRVFEKVQAELLVGLIKGEFDFIIGQTQYYDHIDGLKQRVLFRDRMSVFARPSHPLFEKDDLTWADLTEYPWVSPMVGRLRTLLETILASKELTPPRQMTRAASVEFAREIVVNSDHLTMMPPHAIAIDVSEGRIKALPITVPQLSRNIALIFRERSPLTQLSQKLVKAIEAVGNELTKDTADEVTAVVTRASRRPVKLKDDLRGAELA